MIIRLFQRREPTLRKLALLLSESLFRCKGYQHDFLVTKLWKNKINPAFVFVLRTFFFLYSEEIKLPSMAILIDKWKIIQKKGKKKFFTLL